ncbi:hypothetical protein [Microbacterium sp. Leaf179]|uniref:hypothetical protein n=1 Tax=Microbacterium sp. Leaf179 TaxID=1736288 RepID=UPI0006FFD6D1|nr:hypothetical protein [Microbacterium sp. Leaf179]KQR89096.1 hypothetical protein ASF96_04990 [Microbacterium sp. Leaf179]
MNTKTTMKTRVTGLAALALATTMFWGGAPAYAAQEAPSTDSSTVSAEDAKWFLDNAVRWGVDDDTAQALLERVERGEVLDSDSGAEPVSVRTEQVDGFERTVSTFADGSVRGSDVQIPKEATESDGLSTQASYYGCTLGSSAGVSYGQDCYVYNSSMTIGASFYTSYSVWSGGSSVWNWHTPSVSVVGGNASNQEFTQPNDDAIQLRFNVQTLDFPSSTAWLQFNASTQSASQGGAW